MSLTDKYNSYISPLLPFPSRKPHKSSLPPFEKTLITRLRSLLPIHNPTPSVSLSWLSRAVDVLSQTLTDADALISDPSLSGSDRSAIASYLESSVELLDACNSISGEIERFSRGRLLIRFALHLLSLSGENHRRRARELILEWENSPRREIRRPALSEPPGGKISSFRRAIYAVEALSGLALGSVAAVLGGEEKGAPFEIRVPGNFSWAEAFYEVEAAISGEIRAEFSVEAEAVEACVTRLASVIDGEGDGEKTERLRSAAGEVETALDELTEGMDRLSTAVNGLFRSALCTRNTALQSFLIGPQRCR